MHVRAARPTKTKVITDPGRFHLFDQLLRSVEVSAAGLLGTPNIEAHSVQDQRIALCKLSQVVQRLATFAKKILADELKKRHARRVLEHVRIVDHTQACAHPVVGDNEMWRAARDHAGQSTTE